MNLTDNFKNAYYDFSVKLLKSLEKSGTNTLISPISISQALFQASLGANGKTLEDFKSLFENVPYDEINNSLKQFNVSTKNKGEIANCNSVWLNNNSGKFSVDENFVEKVKEIYSSDVFREKFDDKLVEKINNWCKENTDNLIEKIIHEIKNNAIMYLISALSFKAEWQNPYEDYAVIKGAFKNYNGTKSDVNFLSSKESVYIGDEKSHGFMKAYKDENFAFFALVPKDEMPVNEYIATLSGGKLKKIIQERKEEMLSIKIPEFSVEGDYSLKDNLFEMGFKIPFDSHKADFSNMGKSPDGNIYIGDVLHKTIIKVTRKGTEAGAVSGVIMIARCALMKTIEINFDKPFLFGIVDLENNLPVFLGSCNNI